MPVEKLREHCDPKTMGCAARGKIGETATHILQKHGLYRPTYDNKEQQSAIALIASEVKKFFDNQVDTLLAELSESEYVTHICKADRMLLYDPQSASFTGLQTK